MPRSAGVGADWSQQARQDLLAIFQHVARDDPAAARRLLARIRRSELLAIEHPYAGRIVGEFDAANIHEHIVPPCRVIYQVRPDGVLFLTVVHGRRELRRLGPAAYVLADEE